MEIGYDAYAPNGSAVAPYWPREGSSCSRVISLLRLLGMANKFGVAIRTQYPRQLDTHEVSFALSRPRPERELGVTCFKATLKREGDSVRVSRSEAGSRPRLAS